MLYDLPPPQDIPEYDRERIDKLREMRGLKLLPSFAVFLSDCTPTLSRYFVDTQAKLRSPFVKQLFKCEKDVLESIEEERISGWAEIKGWSGEEMAAAKDMLLYVEKKKDRREARKRRGSELSSPHESSPRKKAHTGNNGEGSLGSNTNRTPRTPSQRERRRSTGGAMPARDTGFNTSPAHHFHSSPLRQEWSSPLANQFDLYAISPITADRLGTSGGHFHSQGQFTTTANNMYSMSAERPRPIRRSDSWDDPVLAMQNPPSRMTGANSYGSMHGMAPPQYGASNLQYTGAMGNPFAPTHQQHMATQVHAPHNGYNMMHMAAPAVPNHPDLRIGSVNPADLAVALRNHRQRADARASLPHDPRFHTPGTQAPGQGSGNPFQGRYYPQVDQWSTGFHTPGTQAPGHGSGNPFQGRYYPQIDQQSTGFHQQEGSNNVVHQTDNNLLDST